MRRSGIDRAGNAVKRLKRFGNRHCGMGGFRLFDDQAPTRAGLRQRRRLGNAVAAGMGEDDSGRIGKARSLGFEPVGREGHERHGKMLRHRLHGRLPGARIQRRDEGDIPGPGDDGDGERYEFGGRRAAFAAEAENERASSNIG